MNTEIFNVIHDITGFNDTIDAIVVFCAKYLVYILFAVAVAAISYLAVKRQWRPVIFFGIQLAATFAVILIASHFYPSQRPFVVDPSITPLISHDPNQSFPSSHTAVSFAIALGLLFFTRFKGLGLLAVIAAGIIGIARIAAGVHWPLDIAGSMGAALLAAILIAIPYRITRPNTSSVQFDRPDKA